MCDGNLTDASSKLFLLFSTKAILNTPHMLKHVTKRFFTQPPPPSPLDLYEVETIKKEIPLGGACRLS